LITPQNKTFIINHYQLINNTQIFNKLSSIVALSQSTFSGLALKENKTKIVIYGGNGFVGTNIAERLSELDVCAVCLSRTGHKPLHLNHEQWSTSVRWCKGDASKPDLELLSEADVVIILVGSAPIPTFSKAAFDQQLFNNGTAPCAAIQGAKQAGVKRIILMGASIPFVLNTKHFAYANGKNMARQNAKDFASSSDEHSAIVMQPGAIYGKRYLRNGKMIPLNLVMGPLAKIMPWQFVNVTKIADRVAEIITNHHHYDGKFTLLKNNEI